VRLPISSSFAYYAICRNYRSKANLFNGASRSCETRNSLSARYRPKTGVNIETTRYYEKVGLMPAPPRTQGRQRVYDRAHLKRLTFIRRGRELGFSLDQIRELLGLVRGHNLTCAEAKAVTEEHVADIRRKVKDLKKLERILTELAARCSGNAVPDCPILDALFRSKGS
jgi:MerR family mercuric resistance operon transcriptional regulator